MENLLPPLLILLAVAAVVVLLLRAGVRRTRASATAAVAGGPDAAAAAAARLSQDQHQAVYSLIARGLAVQAIAVYRQATGAGLVEARNAVLLLERYPQAYRGGRPAPAEPERTAAEDSVTPEPTVPHEASLPPEASAPAAPRAPEPPAAVVRRGDEPERGAEPGTGGGAPAQGAARPQRFPYRYRAIVSNGHQTLEVASNMLNDEIYGEIKALAQIGDAEDAARMLHRHSDISLDEARAFVALL